MFSGSVSSEGRDGASFVSALALLALLRKQNMLLLSLFLGFYVDSLLMILQ